MTDNADDVDLAGGNRGCKCIDASEDFMSLDDHACVMDDRETTGVRGKLGGPCVPPTYGSHTCSRHDEIHLPACWSVDPAPPAHCFRPWCFVDRKECSRYSSELIFRDSFFPADSGVDLFYSYSTCNSTADDSTTHNLVGGVSIEAAVPSYVFPYVYKREPNTTEALHWAGEEYFDDTVPYAGVYVAFVNDIVDLSEGDISKLSFTHRSRGSSVAYPTSNFTACVRDIESGLIDMAVGPFWVTSERLKMAAFTIPFSHDETVLVIDKPTTDDKLRYQMSKVLRPFSYPLWSFVVLMIVVSALLSVWFSEKLFDSKTGKVKRRSKKRRNMRKRPPLENVLGGAADATIRNLTDRKKQRRAAVYTRLSLDSFFQEGMFFFGGAVEQDQGASLPKKLLMFGFAFFILITNSAYVANLAAFLTLSELSRSVNSMEEAIQQRLKICAHPVMKDALQERWPEAKFIFSEHDTEFYGLLTDFDAGRCDIMAVGRVDTMLDLTLMEMYCKRELVFTNALVITTPLAFPINSNLAAGFSYWMVEGKKFHGISIPNEMMKHRLTISCDSIEIDVVEDTGEGHSQITLKNMALPIIFYVVFVTAAIIIQIVKTVKADNKNASLMGRISTLNQWANKSVRRPLREGASSNSNDILDEPESRMTGDKGNLTVLETNEDSRDTFTMNDGLVSASPFKEKSVSFAIDCTPPSSKEFCLNNLPGVNSTSTEKIFHAMNSDAPATENNSSSTKTEMEKRLRRLAQNSNVLDEVIALIQDIKREKTS